MDAAEQDESQKYFGLFCAPRAKAVFLNLPAPNQYKFSQTKTVQKQLEDLYKRSPEADILHDDTPDSDQADSPESIQGNDVRSMQEKFAEIEKADSPPICPNGVESGHSGHLSKKDLERLEVIERLRRDEKTTLKAIIHLVWSDIDGELSKARSAIAHVLEVQKARRPLQLCLFEVSHGLR